MSTMNEATDFYSILGVAQTATIAEIKDHFRFLSHAYHPDKFATQEQRNKAEEQFKKINESYSVLSDPTARARYDASRIEPSDPWSNYPPDIPESIVPDMPMWQQVLRWIAMLPGAVVGHAIVYFIGRLLTALNEDAWLGSFVASGASGYALVWCAAWIAPRAKITVAITFGALFLALTSMGSLYYIKEQEWLQLTAIL